MLEPEEMETAAGGMDSEVEDYQRELLTIEAAGLLAASTLAGYHAARDRITRQMMTAAAKHAPRLRKAAVRTYSQALRYSAVEDAEAARMSESVRRYHVAEARMRAEQAAEAFRAEPLAREMARSASNDMMRRATGLAVARASSGAAGYERAVASAVADLSARGVTAFTYTRIVDGIPRTVRMSADAYVRQRLLTDIKRETYEATLSAAGISGANLVAVSCTITCRDTHAPWEGRIYQLNGSGKYPNFYERTMYVYGTNPNWAEGLGGYNCNHSFRIWHPGIRRDDPLKDTGYTRHEAAEIVGRQRVLERGIRASKRQREVMRANGLDTSIVGARLRRQTAALNQLIADHPQILRREIWRERTGEAIRRAQGTEGVVHLNATAAAEVRKAKEQKEAWEKAVAKARKGNIHVAKQSKHIVGTKEYAEKAASNVAKGLPAPSYLTINAEEAQTLIRENAGRGEMISSSSATWSHKEKGKTDHTIGYNVDSEGEQPTKAFTIHYSKTGTHIVPRRDDDET